MTAIVTAYLKCDWCGTVTEQAHSEPQARDNARFFGWKRRRLANGSIGDMCPQCRREGRGQEQTKAVKSGK